MSLKTATWPGRGVLIKATKPCLSRKDLRFDTANVDSRLKDVERCEPIKWKRLDLSWIELDWARENGEKHLRSS